MSLIEILLRRSAALHHHLCPRQVLGVRIGLYGTHVLALETPRHNKRLLVLMETDGCAADGVAVATGCWVGRRTLRVIDFGKVAATFVDTDTRRAVRVVPRASIRERAWAYAPAAETKWQAQLLGYQCMPETELLLAQEVELSFSLEELLSRPGCRTICQGCGEEMINEREVFRDGQTLCRACAGQSYYRLAGEPVSCSVQALMSL